MFAEGFLPHNDTAMKFQPRALTGVEHADLMQRLEKRKAAAEQSLESSQEFRLAHQNVAQVSAEINEVQGRSLVTLAKDKFLLKDEVPLSEVLDSLAATGMTVRDIRQAISEGQWQPNLWLAKLREVDPKGFEILERDIRIEHGQKRVGPKSQLEVLLSRRLEGRFSESNKRAIIGLCDGVDRNTKDNSLVWRVLASEGVLPAGLVDNAEILTDMLSVYKLSKTIDEQSLTYDEKCALKAEMLMPYVDRGANPIFIDEVVSGSFKFSDDFFKTVVEGISELREEVDAFVTSEGRKYHHSISGKKALAAVGIAVGLAGIGYYAVSEGYIHPPIPQVSPAAGSASGELPARSKELPDPNFLPESKDKTASNSKKQNEREVAGSVSAEDFIRGSKQVIWEVDGDTNGYFRQDTASKFGSDHGQVWYINKSPSVFYDVKFDHSDTIQRRKIKAPTSGTYFTVDLPVKDNSYVNYADVEVMDAKGNKMFPVVNFHTDGTYTLTIYGTNYRTINAGEELSIKVGSTNVDKSNSPAAIKTFAEYSIGPIQSDFDSAIEVSKLPGEVQKVIEELNNNVQLSPFQKAQVFTQWWRKSSLYSLDERWNDFYNQADDQQDYFNRIFDKKRVTCDGANTALVMALRAMGIPSRNVEGFMNNGIPIFPNTHKLTANKLHSWVEAYVESPDTGNSEWTRLDGTPTKLDPESRKALAKLMDLNIGDIEGLLESLTPEALVEQFLYLGATLEELYQSHGMVINTSAVAGGVLGYLATAIGIRMARNRMRHRYFENVEGQVAAKFENLRPPEEEMQTGNVDETVKRLLRKFGLDTLATNSKFGSSVGAFFQPLGLRTIARLPAYGSKLNQMEKHAESLRPASSLDDVVHFVSETTGVSTERVERAIMAENETDILQPINTQANMLLRGYVLPKDNKYANTSSWVPLSQYVKEAESYEEFVLRTANGMYKMRRDNARRVNREIERLNKTRMKNARKEKGSVQIEKPMEIPEMSREAFGSFFDGLLADQDFLRLTSVYYKTYTEPRQK